MVQFLPYVCRVCKKPGLCEYDDGDLGRDYSEFAEMLCHNLCADFVLARNKAIDAVDACLTWMRITTTEENKADVQARGRSLLVTHTKKFCSAVTRYYRKPPAWEPDLADSILKNPPGWFKVLKEFERKQRGFTSVSSPSGPEGPEGR